MSENKLKNQEEDVVDLKDLAEKIWSKKNKILKITLLFTFLGLGIAFLLPNQFTASSTFIPQTAETSKGGGSIGGLATLAGIDLSGVSNTSEIPPSLYPRLASSVKFKKALMEARINIEGSGESITYAKYYDEIIAPGVLDIIQKYTIGLPSLIFNSLRKNQKEISPLGITDLIKLTKSEVRHFKRLESQLTVTPNEKEGIVQLSFVMPEPLMAAQMAQFSENLLQQEVIAFKISNAREQLKFTEERFSEKEKEFEGIQLELATFRDRNQNLTSASVMNRLQRLEAEYSFAFNVYTEMSKQLEQAKLKVSKDTPIFSVIQPIIIPIDKSAPKRPLILFIFMLLGFFISIGYIFILEFLQGLNWNLSKGD